MSIPLMLTSSLILLAATVGTVQGAEEDAATPLIVEVYYYTLVANEYVAIFNPKDTAQDLSGWALTDREGTIAFPADTVAAPGQSIVVAQNSTLFYRDTLATAQFSYAGGDAPSMLRKSGTFALNNRGDEVLLIDPTGEIVDAFVYGDSTYDSLGWEGAPAIGLYSGCVATRLESSGVFFDTDSSADWNNIRSRVIGQSSHPLVQFEFDGVAQGILSPDTASSAILDVLGLANHSIFLNAYELTNQDVAAKLLAAMERGVDVRMLVEGSPVGGMKESELNTLMMLRGAGASVRLLLDNADLGVKARYRYDHAKYLVVDNRTVIVSSENWVRNGFPPIGISGNRGWSVRLDNEELAGFMTEVFIADWNPSRMDSVDISDSQISPVSGDIVADSDFAPKMNQRPFHGRFRVTPIVGPDNTLARDAVIGLIRSAQRNIHIEQFYVCKSWGGFSNLYLDELLEAARRGVEVRVLLDSSWYNIEEEDTNDNDDAVAYINEFAANESLPILAKLGNSASHGFVKIHNKGMVVDGEKVLISSINWNLNSVTDNREIGLIVENDELAAFFDEAFIYDWKDDVSPPFADAGDDLTLEEGSEAYLVGSASRDDVGIVSFMWDIGGDGVYELNGSIVSWRFSSPGIYTVILRVRDAWGNEAFDRVNVTVMSTSPPSGDPGWDLAILLAFGAAVIVACMTVIFAYRRRKR